jgi:hypothetical protein
MHRRLAGSDEAAAAVATLTEASDNYDLTEKVEGAVGDGGGGGGGGGFSSVPRSTLPPRHPSADEVCADAAAAARRPIKLVQASTRAVKIMNGVCESISFLKCSVSYFYEHVGKGTTLVFEQNFALEDAIGSHTPARLKLLQVCDQ